VYGARSRFLTDRLLATMDTAFHGRPETASKPGTPASRKIDVANRLKEMW